MKKKKNNLTFINKKKYPITFQSIEVVLNSSSDNTNNENNGISIPILQIYNTNSNSKLYKTICNMQLN